MIVTDTRLSAEASPPQSAVPAPLARRVLIVEDLPDTRDWLCDVVREAMPEVEVTALGRLDDARRWLAALPDIARDGLALALVDLGLPDGSGIDLVRELADRFPKTVPVVATVYDDDSYLFDAIAAGAQGYVLKDQDADVLVHRLRRIEDGEPMLSPSIARRMMAHFRRSAAPTTMAKEGDGALTPRELEVLALLGRGSRVPEAARRLGLTEHTVSTYVKIIYRKLRISSRAEAALEASRRGLI
jgi:DNA-binding NarL/FixJ family response regulator